MSKPRKKTPVNIIIRNKINSGLRYLSADRRMLPSFIIVGAAKCGTTSLYNYLIQHPNILPSSRKEVHYFDYYHHKGLKWYKSHFPLKEEADRRAKEINGTVITGESTPYYFAHPLAAARAKALLPNARLLIMLRNPIERAISSYNNQVRLGIEKLPTFEAAVRAEATRIEGHEARLKSDPSYSSYEHKYFAYIRRGEYADQLEQWLQHYPIEQFTILQSEKFFADAAPCFKEVINALGIPEWRPEKFKVFNAGGEYEQMDPALRQELEAHYKPQNEKLYSLIGKRFDW